MNTLEQARDTINWFVQHQRVGILDQRERYESGDITEEQLKLYTHEAIKKEVILKAFGLVIPNIQNYPNE